MTKQSKGILPDGKKLKELRRRAGKTQKGLIQSSAIQLRTYQRAEQGLPILPELLQQIGVLLGKDVSELRLEKPSEQPIDNAIRLYCANHFGANQLVSDLHRLQRAPLFYFGINPNAETAGQVANVVEYCQALAGTKDAPVYLAPADQIRAIGYLNDLLGSLARVGVYMYAALYYTYDNEILNKDEPEPFQMPTISANVRIVFAANFREYITQTYSAWQTEKAAAERATNWNLARGIRPEIVEQGDFFGDYGPTYRKAYEEHRAQQEPPLLLEVVGTETGA